MKTIYALALVVVAVVVVLALTGNIPAPEGWGIGPEGESSGGSSISHMFHSLIDPYYPGALAQAEAGCITVGGTWFDQDDKMGCYDMPPGAFNESSCTSTLSTVFSNICEGIEGATWVCMSTQAGCNY